jgi:plasmid stabilization system protein ParE
MQVRSSLPAAEDLARICERIDLDNPEAARRVARTLDDDCADEAVEISRIFHGANGRSASFLEHGVEIA